MQLGSPVRLLQPMVLRHLRVGPAIDGMVLRTPRLLKFANPLMVCHLLQSVPSTTLLGGEATMCVLICSSCPQTCFDSYNDCQNAAQNVLLYAGCVEDFRRCDANQSNTALTVDRE